MLNLKNATIVTATFILAVFSRNLLFSFPWYAGFVKDLPKLMQWLEQPLRWFLICWLGLYIAHRTGFPKIFKELGLNKPLIKGLLFSFIACLPMLIGSLFFGKLSKNISLISLVFSAGVWPMAEEILYRGYVFRQFFRKSNMKFVWAALISSLIFGVVHLGQASVKKLPLSGEIGTVLIISLGGILFAWLFVQWQDNLWVPFGMHMFMNLWWTVFSISDSPLGGWGANLLRLLTVILSIVLTLFKNRIPFLNKSR
jgi:membrane protease YdiL (CAAX protease family)